jgi:thiazole/oxazole-forming peptide maturase SagD family component
MERDAFLLSWYSQTPGTRLATTGLDDTTNGLLEWLSSEGYEARIYDITTDNGMPAVWALALDPHNPDGASLSAAAAHPNPATAVRGALAEVTTMAVFGNRRTDHPTADERRAMLADPTLVRSIDDHVALHTLPEALEERLGWLIDAPGEPVPVADRFGDWRGRWLRDDLTETLGLVVDAMAAAGTPPVAVRQTTARDERLGIEVVKVVAPGALAVTFGHVHHRTRGLPRLDRARAAAGVTGPVLPHPFP